MKKKNQLIVKAFANLEPKGKGWTVKDVARNRDFLCPSHLGLLVPAVVTVDLPAPKKEKAKAKRSK